MSNLTAEVCLLVLFLPLDQLDLVYLVDVRLFLVVANYRMCLDVWNKLTQDDDCHYFRGYTILCYPLLVRH